VQIAVIKKKHILKVSKINMSIFMALNLCFPRVSVVFGVEEMINITIGYHYETLFKINK